MPPRLARLLAVLVAIALVVGAFAVRARLADDRDGGDSGDGEAGSDGNGDDEGRSGDLVVVCVTELADVCEAVGRQAEGMAVRVEEAATTAGALVALDAGAEPPADAWVTLDPWPAMVDVVRASASRDPLFAGDEPATAASSTFVVLGFADRIEPCGEPVAATCLVQQVAAEGLKVGLPSGDEALGVLATGQVAAGLAGATDFDVGAFRAEHGRELEDILASADPASSATQARLLVQQGAGRYGAVSTTEAIARPVAESARGVQLDLVIVAGEPAARADAVVAPLVGGDRGDQVRGLLTGKTAQDAFAGAGWDRPGDGPTGLPPADVLVALREEIG